MLSRGGRAMVKYTLRAVSRDSTGKASDIADSWPLTATSLEEAKAEADRQKWGEAGDVANAFEITDETGTVLAWRRFRKGSDDASWS
jgi:hypothetical protein